MSEKKSVWGRCVLAPEREHEHFRRGWKPSRFDVLASLPDDSQLALSLAEPLICERAGQYVMRAWIEEESKDV